MTSIDKNWPFERTRPVTDEAIYDVLLATETELDRIDVQADELKEQRFLNTATTGELEKLAAEVGVSQETGESEERFRFRATIAKGISKSNGTLPDFAQTLKLLFGDDVARITVDSAGSDPVVQLIIPDTMIGDIPLTKGELEDELEDAVPAGDALSVTTNATFELGATGSKGLGNGGLI